jgi:hypothetical protein
VATNLLLTCRTPVFHDLVTGHRVGEGQDGVQGRLTTQAFVARWDPDTGERQGGPGAEACTHRSRPRSGGPFSRSGQSTPPWKGTRCDALGASRDLPRSCPSGSYSPPAADATGGHGRPSKVPLDPVRQGTPRFGRLVRGRLCEAALSRPAARRDGGVGRNVRGDGVPRVPAAVSMYDGCVQWVCGAGEGTGGWVVRWIDTGWRGRYVGKQGDIPEKGAAVGPGSALHVSWVCEVGMWKR